MDPHRRSDGQVTDHAAEVYERDFVPALFAPWAPRLADRLVGAPTDRLLDVATGTGVLARALAERVGPAQVVGCDRNPGMLSVARSRAPDVRWQTGAAEALPFDDEAFDGVGCQFGLMFFDHRRSAIEEMWRVLRPGGRLVVAVWGSLEDNQGYLALVRLLETVCGASVADELRAPFALGDPAALHEDFTAAGVEAPRVERAEGRSIFASLDAWLHTNVRGWTLGPMVSDAAFARLLERAPDHLGGFVAPSGRVELTSVAQVVVAEKG
jgi:SAM-dependent methyltransferase